MSKVVSLSEAAALIPDGASLAVGGNTLHRGPFALVRELARQRRGDLTIIKTAGAYEIDLLAAAGCLRAAACGFVGFESEFGLAPNYRRAVEAGAVEAREHTCYTLIQGLRAAAFGLPFMPAAGLAGSDLVALRGFRTVTDPYSGVGVYVVPPIQPDWALIHVQAADADGNARIDGSEFEDVLMSRAARGVIVTTERVVSSNELARQPELTKLPGFLVTAVVAAPGGAWPGSCHGVYDYDPAGVRAYLSAASDPTTLAAYLTARDHAPMAAG